MVPDCPPGPLEDSAAPLPSLADHTPSAWPPVALKQSAFLTRGRKLRRYRDPQGREGTQLSGPSLLLLISLYSLSSLPGTPPHSIYKYMLPNVCSPNSYFHKHNINIPRAENRDYVNIIKYISFSLPRLCGGHERKTTKNKPHPVHMKTKCSLDQRISENWLRIKLLKYFH